jgi:hypothetical protein
MPNKRCRGLNWPGGERLESALDPVQEKTNITVKQSIRHGADAQIDGPTAAMGNGSISALQAVPHIRRLSSHARGRAIRTWVCEWRSAHGEAHSPIHAGTKLGLAAADSFVLRADPSFPEA